MSAQLIDQGQWQDGTSTDVVYVVVTFTEEKNIVMEFPDGTKISKPKSEAKLSSAMAGLPLRINFADGTLVTIPDGPLANKINRGFGSYARTLESKFFKLLVPLVAGCVLVGYVFVQFVIPNIADRVAQRIPVAFINEFGAIVSESVIEEMGMYTDDKISTIGEQVLADMRPGFELAQGDEDYLFSFHLFGEVGDGEYNAFALPHGAIAMSAEMFATFSDEEIYAILGHEVAHVLRRHSIEGVIRYATWYILGAFIFNDYELIILPVILAEMGYSRLQESEADCDAALMMRRIGKDPYAITDGLQSIAAAYEAQEGGVGDKSELSEQEQERLAEIEELEKQRQEQRGDTHTHDETTETPAVDEQSAIGKTVADLLATHPDDGTRLERVEKCLADNPA